ncbi:helix-turn-helix domain-containing protein [Rossellomorea aquimaris]|uniref:PucR family transcriptional regulator n=1 Tax=Rossellomorea aquimaris TaxID=189382 RepID=UPI001CD4556A|nr:helix-turn-helix domain-containing protein [Rossellomorea aquimaris]MCA1056502.1 helix-turn-helix domain-containing protein [Rossellomorea aquimaris]
MFTSLLLKYPNATVQKQYPSTAEPGKIWFSNEHQDEFIGIDANDLTKDELELLRCLFNEMDSVKKPMNDSRSAMEWYHFLYEKGPVPSHSGNEYRVIQFSLKEQMDMQPMKEAFEHLLPLHSTLIFIDEHKGLIIEEQNELNLDGDQLRSISHVIESDFFVSISFFIGSFQALDVEFVHHFHQERELFTFSRTRQPSVYVQSVKTVLPRFMLHQLPVKWKQHFFGKARKVFEEEPELIQTVKSFLENQSNISQTAKTLFMHRNSVQYRIDKFIEKTAIDIKSFEGGLLAYLAVLDFETDNLPKK